MHRRAALRGAALFRQHVLGDAFEDGDEAIARLLLRARVLQPDRLVTHRVLDRDALQPGDDFRIGLAAPVLEPLGETTISTKFS